MQGQARGKGESGPAGVNKNFLLNTVRGLKSHNKREEEEDCWRQHDLEQKAKSRRLSHDTSRARRSTEETSRAADSASEAETRQFWAEQKQKAMAAATPSAGGVGTAAVVDGMAHGAHGDGRERRERDRADKTDGRGKHSDEDSDASRLEKKRKRAKKKKKKRKRESRRNRGSDTDSGGDDVGVEESRRDGDDGSEKRHTRRKKSKKHKEKKSKR